MGKVFFGEIAEMRPHPGADVLFVAAANFRVLMDYDKRNLLAEYG